MAPGAAVVKEADILVGSFVLEPLMVLESLLRKGSIPSLTNRCLRIVEGAGIVEDPAVKL